MKNVSSKIIENSIFSIRNSQVILDSDLAMFFEIETRALNQAVKRNIKRFPPEFMFQLSYEEWEILLSRNYLIDDGNLKSQNVISSSHGGRRKLPYVFTEQGVAMLSAVLKSEIAIKMSIQIIKAFVAMRRILITNNQLFQRINTIELKQAETDKKFEEVFKALESSKNLPEVGIFFDGQIFDAWKFTSDLLRTAKKSIILIDNFIDDSVLSLFSKVSKYIEVDIYTKNVTKQLEIDVKKFNSQYFQINIHQLNNSHDRFIIIDKTDLYHIGASLKDLGKKWFAFSKMDNFASIVLNKLNKN